MGGFFCHETVVLWYGIVWSLVAGVAGVLLVSLEYGTEAI